MRSITRLKILLAGVARWDSRAAKNFRFLDLAVRE